MGGGMETSVAQDLSQYGFMGVAIEYRLAPPHTEMNIPVHPFPGQNTSTTTVIIPSRQMT